MTAADLSPDDHALLNRAASLLDLVGRFADDDACGLMAMASTSTGRVKWSVTL